MVGPVASIEPTSHYGRFGSHPSQFTAFGDDWSYPISVILASKRTPSAGSRQSRRLRVAGMARSYGVFSWARAPPLAGMARSYCRSGPCPRKQPFFAEWHRFAPISPTADASPRFGMTRENSSVKW